MREFGHKRKVRDASTGQVLDEFESPAQAVTREPLGGAFGADKRRKLAVSLVDGDLIRLRPSKTQRSVTISAFDVYTYCLRCRANVAVLERAREKKARKAQRLADQRSKRASDRLTREAHQHQSADGSSLSR